ncbi:MAG: adenylosuccinate lyase [Candidatus Ranarchaeia archaeon]
MKNDDMTKIGESIHTIDNRYFTSNMRKLFTEKARLQYFLDVEVALAEANAYFGKVPKDSAKTIKKFGNTDVVKVSRVKEIEAEIHHDLMAVVKAFTEQCGDSGKYIHVGATSYDIIDTANALQFRDALLLIEDRVISLLKRLIQMAEETRELVTIGRTHGQHALPTTYGMKLCIWADEVARHVERINEIKKRVLLGKMSGAVGTQASFGKEGLKIQTLVMKKLGISSSNISNQVVQRDGFAELAFLLALIGATLEKISKEIRNLQRTEIDEIAEPFKKKQVGSSTMSHKRNPHKSERICGLARVLRGDLYPIIENIALEHERDLTNSSVERTIFPEMFILVDFMLKQQLDILIGLEFFPENIQNNLEMTKGLIMSENVMLNLVNKGLGRQDSHEILRQSAIKAKKEKLTLTESLSLIDWKKYGVDVSEVEISNWVDPKSYIGTAVIQVTNLCNKLRKLVQKFERN